MKKIALLVGVYVFMASSPSYALTCESLPSCESLGYIYEAGTSDPEKPCYGISQVLCPFDNTKAYCKKSTSVPCKVGMLYDSELGGCNKDNTGDWMVTEISSGECRIISLNGVLIEDVHPSTSPFGDMMYSACDSQYGTENATGAELYYAYMKGQTSIIPTSGSPNYPVYAFNGAYVELFDAKTGKMAYFDHYRDTTRCGYTCAQIVDCADGVTGNFVSTVKKATCVVGAWYADEAQSCAQNSNGFGQLLVSTNGTTFRMVEMGNGMFEGKTANMRADNARIYAIRQCESMAASYLTTNAELDVLMKTGSSYLRTLASTSSGAKVLITADGCFNPAAYGTEYVDDCPTSESDFPYLCTYGKDHTLRYQ